MIKIVFCLRRLASLSRAEFQAYWRDMHAPLVAEHAPTLGIERYVQCHTLDNATFAGFSRSRGGHPPFDGVAELWFSEVPAGPVEERRRASQILLDDEHRFIDLPASPIFFTREHEVLKDFIDLRAQR